MNSWNQMAKTLSLSQEDATNLTFVEGEAKIATNNALGESFVTVRQFHCTSVLTILLIAAKCENFCSKLGKSAKKTGTVNFNIPRISKPDSSTAIEKQDSLSKIDDMIKDMPNDVKEDKTPLNHHQLLASR